jgi:seryl-tRNA synthetase
MGTPSLRSLKDTVENTISGLDKTDRLLPGLQSANDKCGTSQASKVGKYGWLQSKILDLDKIDKVVKSDLEEIQMKLSKFNKKITNSNMSDKEAASLKNDISSIQQNQLGAVAK